MPEERDDPLFLYKGREEPIRVDLADWNDPRTLLVRFTRPGAPVLDIGCNTGFCARVLASRGCRVVGIEQDPAAAERARGLCEEVLVGDVETMDLAAALPARRFEVVSLGGLLEHTRDPRGLLGRLHALLAPEGALVLYVPNIAHWSVRLALLAGRFDYEETGLLDDTHLVHFTRSSLWRMLGEAGYGVEAWEAVRVPAERGAVAKGLSEIGLERETDRFLSIFSRPDATAYIWVVKARPARATR